jgi:hypothetical protein
MAPERSIADLIQRLRDAGFDLQADEIADILWLSSRISVDAAEARMKNRTPESPRTSRPNSPTDNEEISDESFEDALSTPTGSDLTSATALTRQTGSTKTTDQDLKAALTVENQKPGKALPYPRWQTRYLGNSPIVVPCTL